MKVCGFLFLQFCSHSITNSKLTIGNTPVEYILLPFGKKKSIMKENKNKKQS